VACSTMFDLKIIYLFIFYIFYILFKWYLP
jgi:hypothetical protein